MINKKSPQTAGTVSEEKLITVESNHNLTEKEWNEMFRDLPLGDITDSPEKIKPCNVSKESCSDEC